jgi:hypothetical protein
MIRTSLLLAITSIQLTIHSLEQTATVLIYARLRINYIRGLSLREHLNALFELLDWVVVNVMINRWEEFLRATLLLIFTLV